MMENNLQAHPYFFWVSPIIQGPREEYGKQKS